MSIPTLKIAGIKICTLEFIQIVFKICFINNLEDTKCQGLTNRLKFIGKTNRLKEMLIFTILANFVHFSCISNRNLFILLKFTL